MEDNSRPSGGKRPSQWINAFYVGTRVKGIYPHVQLPASVSNYPVNVNTEPNMERGETLSGSYCVTHRDYTQGNAFTGKFYNKKYNNNFSTLSTAQLSYSHREGQ